MIEHLKNALQSWPQDTDTEACSLEKNDFELIKAVAKKSKSIEGYIKDLENITFENEELYDTAYTDSHFISGFGKIAKCEKIHHLGQLLELISSAARNFQNYSNFSMVYLYGLILSKIDQICVELLKSSHASADISDVVNECLIYLKEPLQQILEKERRKTSDRAIIDLPHETVTVPEIPALEVSDEASSSTGINDTLEDELPEITNIPTDKVGLISDFCEEVWESLQESENILIELENKPESKDLINQLFRAVHTIKGGSRLLEIKKIERLSHELETVLDQIRSDKKSLTANIIDLALACIKRITEITHEVASREPINTRVNDLVASLQIVWDTKKNKIENTKDHKNETLDKNSLQITDTKIISPEKQDAKGKVVREESIKISAEKLESVLNASSEVYITRIRLQNDQRELSDAIFKINEDIEKIGKDLSEAFDLKSVEIYDDASTPTKNTTAIRTYNNLAKSTESGLSLRSSHADLLIGVERLSIQNKNIQKNVEDLEVLSSRLQSSAMNFRMVPVSTLFSRFPAQVRDLARQIGKRVELKVTGSETELDKILINQLSDPLLHIIRNSIDHGIENPETRSLQGKHEIGKIDLRAYYMGSNAIIEIEDDGKGIDTKIILAKAVEKGLILDGSKTDISEKEIFDFIFEPGFSSAEVVTELSGRGVGMDVVKTSINRMQGSIKLESQVNKGTKITLRLPLTLAVLGILLVSENGFEFAFPILNVDEVIHINLAQDVKRINDTLVYNFRSELIPINYLSDFLGYGKNPKPRSENFLLILNDGEKKIGIIVDEVLGQQNVLLKQLGSLIDVAPFVIGCTILSTSNLVLILNVQELTNHVAENGTAKVFTEIEKVDQIKKSRGAKVILVVDDSGIQRKRICDFMEFSGYKTVQAGDGYEALDILRTNQIDGFCIDIQMPLMDGYELIDRLKLQPKFDEKPIFVISGIQMNKDNSVLLMKEKRIKNFYEKPVELENLLEDLDEYCLDASKQDLPGEIL